MPTNSFKQLLLKRFTKKIILGIIFAILIYLSLFVGEVSITPVDLIRGDTIAWKIFRTTRVPRTLAIILAASGLSVAGLIMQSISRNKFMAPSTSGANDAAVLGLVVGMIFFNDMSLLTMTIVSFMFSFLAIMVFTSVINSLKVKESSYIPLLGMMFGSLLSALTSVIAHRFDILQLVQGISVGTFNLIGGYGLIYLVAIPLIIITIFAHKFSIIGMGEDFAKNLGVNYNKVVFVGLLCVALVSSTVFVSVGVLPFIGLIIPNLVSTIYGDNIKKSLTDLMVFGSSFLLLADIASRIVLPQGEIPVGITISILGGVVFLTYMLGGIKNAKQKTRS